LRARLTTGLLLSRGARRDSLQVFLSAGDLASMRGVRPTVAWSAVRNSATDQGSRVSAEGLGERAHEAGARTADRAQSSVSGRPNP
jgi:hypothetical protein